MNFPFIPLWPCVIYLKKKNTTIKKTLQFCESNADTETETNSFCFDFAKDLI